VNALVKALLNRREDQVGPVANESNSRGKAEKDPSETLKSEKNGEPGQASLSASLQERVSGKQDQSEINRHLVKNRDKKSEIDSLRDVGESNTSAGHHADEKVPSVKHKAQSDIANDKPSKKMRLSTDSVKPDDLQTNKHATGAEKILMKSDKDSGKVSTQLHKENSEKMKPSEKKVKSSGELLQKAEDHLVTRRPEVVSFPIHYKFTMRTSNTEKHELYHTKTNQPITSTPITCINLFSSLPSPQLLYKSFSFIKALLRAISSIKLLTFKDSTQNCLGRSLSQLN